MSFWCTVGCQSRCIMILRWHCMLSLCLPFSMSRFGLLVKPLVETVA